METNYSVEIANAIENFLIKDDWKFDFDERKGIFHFGVKMQSKIRSSDFLIIVKDLEYLVYAFSPIEANINDEETMAELAEYFTRANYGLRNGNFEMDYDDGEIRYKTHVDFDGLIPSYEVIKNSIYKAAGTLD